jgi:hypothetical protein
MHSSNLHCCLAISLETVQGLATEGNQARPILVSFDIAGGRDTVQKLADARVGVGYTVVAVYHISICTRYTMMVLGSANTDMDKQIVAERYTAHPRLTVLGSRGFVLP